MESIPHLDLLLTERQAQTRVIPRPVGLTELPLRGDAREATRELAVDWRLTTQPNSHELVGTQVKSRSPEVLTPQHSDALFITQHNSAKLVQFGLLICGLTVRFRPGSPLLLKDLERISKVADVDLVLSRRNWYGRVTGSEAR